MHRSTVCGSVLALFVLAGCGNGTVIGSGTPSPRPSITPKVTYEYKVSTAAADPFALVTGYDGYIYFTEFAAGKIGQLTTGGTVKEIAPPTASSGPASIIVGPDNHIWFTEQSAGKIATFVTFLTSSISEHTVPWANSTPAFLTRGGPFDSLFFTDPGANAIGSITTSMAFGGPYAIPTANADPQGITTDQFGNEWFTEYNTAKVGMLNTTSHTITEYNLSANAHPDVILTASDGAMWFTENIAGGAKLGRITTAGSYSEFPLTGANSATGLWQDGYGDFVIADPANNAIGVYKAFGNGSFTEYPVTTAGATPFWISVGPDGKLYFTEQAADQIGQFSYF